MNTNKTTSESIGFSYGLFLGISASSCFYIFEIYLLKKREKAKKMKILEKYKKILVLRDQEKREIYSDLEKVKRKLREI